MKQTLWTLLLVTVLSLTAGQEELRGETGDQGRKGEVGDQGDTGAQGPQGIQGQCNTSDGLCPDMPGDQGYQGEEGVYGEKGVSGEQGKMGEQGSDGEPGENGKDGAPGKMGAKGEPGEDGEDGRPGERAPPCSRDDCLAGIGELGGDCVQVTTLKRHRHGGYWKCPTDYVITGFKSAGEKDMLVTCCHI